MHHHDRPALSLRQRELFQVTSLSPIVFNQLHCLCIGLLLLALQPLILIFTDSLHRKSALSFAAPSILTVLIWLRLLLKEKFLFTLDLVVCLRDYLETGQPVLTFHFDYFLNMEFVFQIYI